MSDDPAVLATQVTMTLEPASGVPGLVGAGDTSGALDLGDTELIAAYLEGNLAAYGELARRYQIPLFRLLLGLLADEDLAERACEEVFIVANRRLSELEDPARFYLWLLGIAREVSQNFVVAPNETLPPGPDPRDHLKREVHAVLQTLTPDHRLALVLVELREAEDEEVAAALGCALDSVAPLVAEARAAFVEALGVREQQTLADRSVELDAASSEGLLPGTIIAERYRVEELLGAGGMGAVYRAAQLDDGLEVALKTLLPDLEADATALRRFEREAEAIARLDHRSFVKILDHGQTSEALRYLVMEYLRGRPLSDRLDTEQILEPAHALELIRELLEGLEHAHELGVVHRDLKPENVMLVPEASGAEQAKILDLGLAKFVERERSELDLEQTRLTRQGMVFGTPAYMSPEQALGQEVDARADLYAITVMLFELLTGELPFNSANPSALLVKHVSQPAPPLGSLAVHLGGSPDLQALVSAGLAKQPDERIPSARDYLARVEALLRGPLPQLTAFTEDPTRQLPTVKGPPTSLLSEARQLSAEHPQAVADERAPSGSRVWLIWALVLLALLLAGLAYRFGPF